MSVVIIKRSAAPGIQHTTNLDDYIHFQRSRSAISVRSPDQQHSSLTDDISTWRLRVARTAFLPFHAFAFPGKVQLRETHCNVSDTAKRDYRSMLHADTNERALAAFPTGRYGMEGSRAM